MKVKVNNVPKKIEKEFVKNEDSEIKSKQDQQNNEFQELKQSTFYSIVSDKK